MKSRVRGFRTEDSGKVRRDRRDVSGDNSIRLEQSFPEQTPVEATQRSLWLPEHLASLGVPVFASFLVAGNLFLFLYRADISWEEFKILFSSCCCFHWDDWSIRGYHRDGNGKEGKFFFMSHCEGGHGMAAEGKIMSGNVRQQRMKKRIY